MAEVNISEAARLAGKGRSTIQRHIKLGKLSAGTDAAGNPVIETSELCRVYGSIQADGQKTEQMTQDETPTLELLREQLRQAHEREEWLRNQLESAQARSAELEQRMLPQGAGRKGFFRRLFGS